MKLLTTTEVAKILAVKSQTLRRWRLEDKGPPFVRVEGSVRYDAEKLQDWIDTCDGGSDAMD